MSFVSPYQKFGQLYQKQNHLISLGMRKNAKQYRIIDRFLIKTLLFFEGCFYLKTFRFYPIYFQKWI